MEVKKVGQIVDELVKKIKTQESYQVHIKEFLLAEKRNPEAVSIEKQDKNIFLYTNDPQMVYYMQIKKEQILAYLKKKNPQEDVKDIIVRLGNHGRK